MKYCISLILALTLVFGLFAQVVPSENEKFRVLFDRYQQKSGIRILIHDKDISRLNFPGDAPMDDGLLAALTQGTPYSFFIIQDKYAVIYPTELRTPYLQLEQKAVKERDRSQYGVSGLILDNEAKSPSPGALFSIPELELGTIADGNGRFSASVPEGTYVAYFSAMGKETERKIVRVYDDLDLTVTLFESINDLETITVTDRAIDYNVRGALLGATRLGIEELKLQPPLLGEVDIVKSILLLPGVSTVGEGASGFNVRGGGVDQNLILMDGAPVFNPSHMFGFFSIFNQDAIKDASLYKGDIPAKYGGRLSSVLNITTRPGDPQRWKAEGGIGFLSSRIGANGPISDNTQLLVTGRLAYPDWIMHRVPNVRLKESSTYFYDGNIRVDQKINEKNSISLSLYASNDYFRFGRDTAYSWQTNLASLKWRSLWGENLAAETGIAYSGYTYSVIGEIEPLDYSLDSRIDYFSIQQEFEWIGEKLAGLQFGYQVNHYLMGMGDLRPLTESSVALPQKVPDEQGIETGLFAQIPWKLGDKLEGQIGLRYSGYFALGAREVYQYTPGTVRDAANIMDTLSYSAGEVYQRYGGFEPRFTLQYPLGENSSVKASVNRSLQYLHLLSNNFASAPVDLWKLSDTYTKPQESWQYALGFYRNFDYDKIESSLEFYYKDMRSIVEYRDGARLFLNPLLESVLVMGSGYAYGSEFLLKKKSGKLNGWFTYTYSRSMRKVDSQFEEELINGGEYFPANWDQPHDFTLLANYKLRRRISFTATFNFRSGRPITLPNGVYDIGGNIVVDYQERNQARIPDYHRLDLGVTIDGNQKKDSNYSSNWTIAFYNVYGRKNPFSWFFQPDSSGSIPRSYRLAVIGTIIPSITYNFSIK